MYKPPTIEKALAHQASDLAQWRLVLNPEAFDLLQQLVTTSNNEVELNNLTSDYIWRGQELYGIVMNEVLPHLTTTTT